MIQRLTPEARQSIPPLPIRPRAALGTILAFGAMLLLGGCDEGSTLKTCPPNHAPQDGECVPIEKYEIALDTVGFLPNRVKRASVPGRADEFVVRRADDDSVAHTSSLSGPVYNEDTNQDIWTADFTELLEEGEYYLFVRGVGESPRFRIGSGVFADALYASMLGMYGQRCGTAVSFSYADELFSHGACHTTDAQLSEPRDGMTTKDTVGGWHDAGDYGKYTMNGAFSVGFMLMAWEHFGDSLVGREFEGREHGGPIPGFLAEAKWQVDWLLSMQFDDGSVSDIVSTLQFAGQVPPERDLGTRYLGPTGTPDAAAVAAVAAMAARIYEPFDPDYAQQCLEAAQLSFRYLTEHDYVRADLNQRGLDFDVGNYSGAGGYDVWAAAELWESTGDPTKLEEIERHLWNSTAGSPAQSLPRNWDWSNGRPLGLFTYVLSEREGRNLEAVEGLQQNLISVADGLVSTADEHGYGRSLGSGAYYWGSNGVLLRTCPTLHVAYRLTGDERYLDAAVQQVDYVLGRNPFVRSLVTGVGHYPPMQPHHRPSQADRARRPWPGLLVGGPNDQDDTYDFDGLAWSDSADNYWTNEIAINWNAVLIYALAGLVP